MIRDVLVIAAHLFFLYLLVASVAFVWKKFFYRPKQKKLTRKRLGMHGKTRVHYAKVGWTAMLYMNAPEIQCGETGKELLLAADWNEVTCVQCRKLRYRVEFK